MFFKKKNSTNLDYQYVYTVKDKIGKKCIGLFYSTTDENMLRTSLPSILMDYPFRDIEILRIGRFETNTGVIEPLNSKAIALDKYLFPHSKLSPKGEDLSLETLDSSMKEAKNKMMSKIDSAKESFDKKNDDSNKED